jgi:hypothetical protein
MGRLTRVRRGFWAEMGSEAQVASLPLFFISFSFPFCISILNSNSNSEFIFVEFILRLNLNNQI